MNIRFIIEVEIFVFIKMVVEVLLVMMTIETRTGIIFDHVVQPHFEHVSFWYPFLEPHLIAYF